MHEMLQGLLDRPDWEAMRGVPLVQIPCGSGNALAASTGERGGAGGLCRGQAAAALQRQGIPTVENRVQAGRVQKKL